MAVRAVHIKDVVLDGHNRQGMSVCGGMINPTSDRICRLSVGPYAGRWAHHSCALNHLVSLGFITAEDASNVEI